MAQRAIQTVSIGEQSACAHTLCSLAALTVRAICAAGPCQSVAEAIESVAGAIDASFTAAPPPALLPRLPNTPTLTPLPNTPTLTPLPNIPTLDPLPAGKDRATGRLGRAPPRDPRTGLWQSASRSACAGPLHPAGCEPNNGGAQPLQSLAACGAGRSELGFLWPV